MPWGKGLLSPQYDDRLFGKPCYGCTDVGDGRLSEGSQNLVGKTAGDKCLSHNESNAYKGIKKMFWQTKKEVATHTGWEDRKD